jgi:hypothetical protein
MAAMAIIYEEFDGGGSLKKIDRRGMYVFFALCRILGHSKRVSQTRGVLKNAILILLL